MIRKWAMTAAISRARGAQADQGALKGNRFTRLPMYVIDGF